MPPPVSADLSLVPVLSARVQDLNMCGRRSQTFGRLPAVRLLAVCSYLLAALVMPSSASALENALPPPNGLQRLWEEIGNVKTMMSIISDELNRFNTLYLGKLEHRMLAIATALSSVDSNVKNLQERAHVWDTFQLHVAAWNEQIKTLDKKVDILSRGHEKLDLMDGKLSSMLSVDYKLERMWGKLEDTDGKLAALGRAMESHRDSYSLFGDVATRGVVSTLRIIERKVDRLQMGLSHLKSHDAHGGGGGGGRGGGKGGGGRNGSGGRGATVTAEGDDAPASVAALGRGKLIIRCNAPVALEEMLRDVAAKVDVMFDKMSAASDAADGVSGEPPARLTQIHVNELRDLTENKLLERLWKRLTSPFKRTARALEALEGVVRASANASAAALEERAAVGEQTLRCCVAAEHRFGDFASSAVTAAQRLEERVSAAHAQSQRVEARLQGVQEACSAGFVDTSFGNTSGSGRQPADERPRTRERDPEVTPEVPSLSPPDTSGGRERDSSRENSSTEDTEGTTGSGDGESGIGDVEPPFIPVIARSYARNCEDLLGTTHHRESGIYKLGGHEVNSKGRDFYTRFCDMNTNGGGWTVIQRRGLFPGPRQKFSLPWKDYKRGFGDLDKEFWFGNDFIHRLTYQKDMVLRIELGSFDGKKVWAEYSSFRVGPAESNYRLTVGGYTGNATDSLQVHDGASFSTIDRTNDAAPSCCPCAPAYGGGWWFDRADGELKTSNENSCFEANLNGVYFTPRDTREQFRGIIWEHWLGDESLKSVEMKIRPKTVNEATAREDPSFDEHGSSSVDDVDPLDIPEDP